MIVILRFIECFCVNDHKIVPCLLPGASTDTIARIMTKQSTNPKPRTGAVKYDIRIHSNTDK